MSKIWNEVRADMHAKEERVIAEEVRRREAAIEAENLREEDRGGESQREASETYG